MSSWSIRQANFDGELSQWPPDHPLSVVVFPSRHRRRPAGVRMRGLFTPLIPAAAELVPVASVRDTRSYVIARRAILLVLCVPYLLSYPAKRNGS